MVYFYLLKILNNSISHMLVKFPNQQDVQNAPKQSIMSPEEW